MEHIRRQLCFLIRTVPCARAAAEQTARTGSSASAATRTKFTLRELEGLVDIYLPDMKYSDPKLAGILSAAPDYVEIAKAAIAEMYRQVGSAVIEDEIMQRGMIVRHLMLPGELDNTLGVLDWFSEAFPKGDVLFSLMSQYVPMGKAKTMPPYDRRITEDEYDAALSYLELLGIENGFTQDFSAATEEYIPDFSFEGL